jgi:hypothetical protein
LFFGIGIFQEGASDWQRVSSAGREVARNINGRARRQSTSISMTGSGIMPRSPTQPSKGKEKIEEKKNEEELELEDVEASEGDLIEVADPSL